MAVTSDILIRAREAEKQTVASVLLLPEIFNEVAAIVRPQDFFEPAERATFKAMHDLAVARLPIENAMLLDKLCGSPEFGNENPAGYLLELAQSVATAAHAPHYAKQVREASKKRACSTELRRVLGHAENGYTSKQIYDDLFAVVDDWRREDAIGQSLLADLQPANEFVRQDHRVEYLIPYVVVAGQPGIISARAKSLKTTIAIDALISMATATPFLDKWDVPRPVRCGILTAESGPATISETIKRIAASKGIDADGIDNLLVSTKCPRLQSQEWLDEIKRCIEANELRCLVIDPTYLALAGLDQNKLSAVASALGPVGEIIRDTGCTILMVHHNRKVTLSPYGCPTLEEITGSGFAEWSRFWVLLNRRQEWDDQTGQHWLWLVTGGSAGFGTRKWLNVREGKPTDLGGRVWDVEVLSAVEGETREKAEASRQREERAADQLAADKRKLIDVLRHCDGRQETKTALRDRAGVRSQRFGTVLAELLESGDIEPVQICKANNRKYDGFRLAETKE